MTNIIQRQRCKSKEHIAFACLKLIDLRPRCAKCGGEHKTYSCGLKCFFCLGMGHIKDRCWEKNGKSPSTCANFLKMLINDEKALLTKLNQLSGTKHNVLPRVKMPKCKMHVQASTSKTKG
jgi:hypothetical protein